MLKLVFEPDAEGRQNSRPQASHVPNGYVFFAQDVHDYYVSDETDWLRADDYNAGALLVKLGLVMQGGGGTPGGSTTQVQFNDSGSFAGDSTFTFNKVTNTVSIETLAIGAPSPVAPFQTGTGDNQNVFPSVTTIPQLIAVRRGTVASPDDITEPLVKIVRTLAMDATGIAGDGSQQLSALEVQCFSTAAGTSQPVAVFAGAQNSGTANASADVRADAVGLYGVGRITGTGAIGSGFGAVLVGRRDVDTARATTLELHLGNFTATPGTYTANGASDLKGIWLYAAGDSNSGVAIQIQNAFGRQFATGIGFGSQNTGGVVGPTVNNDIQTDSTAAIAYDLRGTHATAAIQDTSTSALGIFLNGTNTDSAIRTASTAGNANFGTTNVAGRRVNAFLSSTAQATNAVGGWFSGQATHASGGAMASVIGVQGQAILNSTQGATTLASVRGLNAHIAAGTVTDSAALLAAAATNSGGATITRAVGVLIEAQTVGTTNLGIRSLHTGPSTFAGTITIGSSTVPGTSVLLDLVSTTGALRIMSMTSTQRDALTASAGMLIYNTTTGTMQLYDGAWKSITAV